MMKNRLITKAMPCLLIIFGFFTLNMFQGYLALACMVVGITMLLNRIWPEKWGQEDVVVKE